MQQFLTNIDFILEILLSEVLEDPTLNERDYLENRVKELYKMKPEDLAKLGKEARMKNESEDEKETEKINEKYKVE